MTIVRVFSKLLLGFRRHGILWGTCAYDVINPENSLILSNSLLMVAEVYGDVYTAVFHWTEDSSIHVFDLILQAHLFSKTTWVQAFQTTTLAICIQFKIGS